VANLLDRSDVFLDMSLYQAFGRTALEAMACGCTAVVPRLGGVWEFVEDGVNALAVETMRPDEAVEALSGLVTDRDRVRSLQSAGLRTAQRYTICRAALSEYLIFSHEHARRFGHDRATA
jgi:glycosyltransferase involved in cell wall biosynthesis